MDSSQTVTLTMSFVAGLLSFVSPCVLPIVPSFMGFISGMTLDQMMGKEEHKHPVLFYTLWFVLGFSLIFVALGASATVVGGLLLRYQSVLRTIGGVFIIGLGLHFMGVFQLSFLQVEKRFHLQSKPAGALGSFLVGVTFALGWTPCIGPILGSILTVAASQGSVKSGIGMLSAYSLGFAIPFLIVAAAFNAFLTSYRRFTVYIPKVLFVSGAFLIVIGVLLITNWFTVLAEYLTGWLSV